MHRHIERSEPRQKSIPSICRCIEEQTSSGHSNPCSVKLPVWSSGQRRTAHITYVADRFGSGESRIAGSAACEPNNRKVLAGGGVPTGIGPHNVERTLEQAGGRCVHGDVALTRLLRIGVHYVDDHRIRICECSTA